ncbi:MAG TPA: tRNA lysidine(34) synthetase TilS [Steroidobacteraceae bacterium]|nr:tRNA lysidine(34) synthetase TilS [Steroidobacteraceae bacterium]
MGVTRDEFDPEWLHERLARLLPGYPDVSVCVAFSGGVDSTALLAGLAALRGVKSRVRAIHVNHGIHPDAGQWSGHCERVASELRVPLDVLVTKVVQSRGTSLEARARDERYALLTRKLGIGEFLLTAHHEDDQLETVLLQLFRGAGLAGLAAMPAVAPFGQGWLARPLLTQSRAALEKWVRSRGIPWVDDATNANEELSRNYLRRQVLPLIRERWPSVAQTVSRSARHIAEGQRLLDELARADVERAADGPALSVKSLRALSPQRRRNALRFWIAQSGWEVPDTRRLEQLAGPLIEARPDANPHIAWGTTVILRHAGRLILQAASRAPGPRVEAIPWSWRAGEHCELGALGKLELRRDRHGTLDLDALPASVRVRRRLGGERLRPIRNGPRRTLKSLLQEAHVPIVERARIPLVFNEDTLLAAGDLWLDASVQAAPGARRRARLIWHR